MTITAIYPGTFDPITNGHLDLIHRATQLFDRVLVAVAANKGKSTCFSLTERLDLVDIVTSSYKNVDVMGFDDLLIDFALRQNAKVILRGLRTSSDFDYEFQLAGMNRRLNPKIETVFLTPNEKCTYISSTLIREIASLGGDVNEFVHPSVAKALRKAYIS